MTHISIQYYIDEIFRSEIWIQLNLGRINENEAKLKLISKISALDTLHVDKLFDLIKSTQELIPGIIDIIKSLHKNGYKLFALTDNVKEIVEYLHNRYEFRKYFTHATVSSNVVFMKPNKEIFDYTLRENKLLPSETLFIDDHKPNIIAASTIGLHTILFTDSISCVQELKKLEVYPHE